jgi:hypothetical protein
MDSVLRERLRLVISVALGVAPRTVKKAFADRYNPKPEEASRRLSEAAADAVLQVYDLAEKQHPDRGAGAQYRGPGGQVS